MGTRADFYIGRGPDARWIGSKAFDGYPCTISPGAASVPSIILVSTEEADYRTRVQAYLRASDDATFPESGWPWPRKDSRTTDYAYAFQDGRVLASRFGCPWFDPLADPETWPDIGGDEVDFPDMAAHQNVVETGPRSGHIVFRFHDNGKTEIL